MDNLAIRALNGCRVRHKPTYVALRAMLDSSRDGDRSIRVAHAAARRAFVRKRWRYYSFPVLKELADGSTARHRECVMGSPFTLLAEAYILSKMSRLDAFALPGNVYSYAWPRSLNSGYNYNFYRPGYVLRNRRIAQQLVQNPQYVVLINDIKSFYPSIQWADLQPRIDRRLQRVEDKETQRAIASFVEGFRFGSGRGVAIGPDISHVLANVALESVDSAMVAAWGGRYFRYVDDILIVCDPGGVVEAQTALESAVQSIGLDLHIGKRDTVTSETWQEECPSIGRGSQPSFEGLLRDLQMHLLIDASSEKTLRTAFAANGLSLPFDRLVSQATYGPFRRFAISYLRRGGWRVRRGGVSGLVETARVIRRRLREQLTECGSGAIPQEGMRRRWFVQSVRYRLNRLMYLENRTTYGEILALVPPGDEFAEYRILIQALRDGNSSSLLSLPGAVVATFCELASEHCRPERPDPWPSLQSPDRAESATMLSLYFGWSFPEQSKANLSQGRRVLLEMFGGSVSDPKQITRQSFLDELELLLRDTDSETRTRYARTRSSEREGMSLEGLRLGGDSLS